MPKFTYTAVADDGRTVKGSVNADAIADARVLLAGRGLVGVKVKERPSLLQTEILPQRVSRSEVMNFSRFLAAFVRAGIPILDAVTTLQEETKNPRFRGILGDIAESLQSGHGFADAVASHSEVFPGFYVMVLQSAEMTGNLDEALDQLATYIERDENARHKIRSAMTYPAVILSVAFVAVVVICAFALPRFEDFFDELDAELPLVTRIMLNITSFVGDFWWAILGGALLVVGATYLYVRTAAGRQRRDRLLLALPALGDVVRFSVVERFCRILGSMVRSGVQLPDAMVVANGSTDNRIYQRALEGAREAMLRGEGIAGPVKATGLFPGAVCQMMRVGEDTGTLGDQLESAATFYGKEVEYRIDRLTSLFEPALMVFIGLVVGFVAIALVSAMYGIFDQVQVQ